MPRFDTRDLGSWEQDVAALAGSFVHEVKNPLSTLSINAQLLLEEFAHATTQREHRAVKRLEVMHAEVNRIERIVDSFLRFAQPQNVRRNRGDINDVLADVLSRNAEALERRKIRAYFQPDEGIGEMELDEELLFQAFLNLVRNAEQAMPAGGELIVRSRLAGAGVEIEFIDTGAGIPPERLSKVFKPYYSTKTDGSGLGLPTTLRIVRGHGGSIVVESEVGRGSRFIVTLPLARPKGAAE
ncbi:MAG: ATP-binding protein [Planctomycetes bacterium]|nr:ATP-binding protein [Planctomycetota bacterium]